MIPGSRTTKSLVAAAALAVFLAVPASATVVNPLPGEDETVQPGVPQDDSTPDPSEAGGAEAPAALVPTEFTLVRAAGKVAVFAWAPVGGKHKYQLRVSRPNSAKRFTKWRTTKACTAKVRKLRHGATYTAQVRVKGHKAKAAITITQP